MQQATVATRAPRGLRAIEAVSAALRRLISERGEVAAVEHLRLSRQTVARLVGMMRVQHATLMLAATRLGVDLVGTVADPEAAEGDGG